MLEVTHPTHYSIDIRDSGRGSVTLMLGDNAEMIRFMFAPKNRKHSDEKCHLEYLPFRLTSRYNTLILVVH
jgi:hypothetical protein